MHPTFTQVRAKRRLFGHHHPGAALRSHACGPHTAAAGADDEEIEFLYLHEASPKWR